MISVYVKFHLKDGSADFFQQWVTGINAEIKKQHGYLQTGGELQDDGAIGYLFLQFDSEENLNKWVATEIHDDYFSRLTPHRGQFEVAKVDTESDDYDPNAALSWKLIG